MKARNVVHFFATFGKHSIGRLFIQQISFREADIVLNINVSKPDDDQFQKSQKYCL